MTAATAPALAADLDSGLRRLKLGTMRRMAPELMVTAKTQRWSPEEFLRTLLDAEITSRDESNARARMKAAAFPVLKTIGEFDVAASSIPQATFDYLASLESIRAAENYCAVGPAGTGKSHSLVAFGVAAVQAGPKVRSSPLPSLSRPSTGAWPTTPSAGLSRTCSAPTWSSRRGRLDHSTTQTPSFFPVHRRRL